MARRSANRRPSGRSQSPATRQSQPAPLSSAAPPAMNQNRGGGGFLSNIAGAVTSGIGHGIGFGIAGRAIDSVLGPRQMEVSHTNEPSVPSSPQRSASLNNQMPANTCQVYIDDLNQCMQRHSDLSLCQNYFEALKGCQQTA